VRAVLAEEVERARVVELDRLGDVDDINGVGVEEEVVLGEVRVDEAAALRRF
jgi:hypothetical protein